MLAWTKGIWNVVAGLWAMVRMRCPRCRKGRMFRGPFTMNDPCPECGLLFQREEGYFLGSMYVSYFLSSGLMIPFYLLLAARFPHLDGIKLAFGAFLLYLPLIPLVWRYSRVVWVHLERAICPGDVSATAYEKFRLRELAEARGAGRDPS